MPDRMFSNSILVSSDLGKLQNCVVEELEKCQESTPANIVDALFKFVKRSACPKKKRSVGIYRKF